MTMCSRHITHVHEFNDFKLFWRTFVQSTGNKLRMTDERLSALELLSVASDLLDKIMSYIARNAASTLGNANSARNAASTLGNAETMEHDAMLL